MPLTETIEHQYTETYVSPQGTIAQEIPTGISDLNINDIILPQTPQLAILKDSKFTVDLEKTISDMLLVIKNMEAQLERVLNLNSSYERELDTSKEVVSKLKAEKAELQDIIRSIEDQIPSKREMQIEIEHVSEEKNDILRKNKDLSSSQESMQKEIDHLTDLVNSFEEEKIDARMEIDYLEVQLKAQQANDSKFKRIIHRLKGEKIALMDKLKTLQDELKQAYDDKFKQYQEDKANNNTQYQEDKANNNTDDMKKSASIHFDKKIKKDTQNG
ncbi:magnetosome protein Mad24-2 [Candidatus Magnetomorum sp. HK-1]|nr:magnetosome protein Mad24-2 [Candidatus Magnetomorum sp. HK-1]